MDTVERFEVGDLTVKIVQDTDPESPREWSNLGTMVCWHRNYRLGDKHTYASPEEFQQSEEFKNAAVILPLYLYDHSGITMRCSPFSCQWDSGQVGYIVISREKIREEYGVKRVSKQLLAKVSGYLESEVKVYDMYLTGDVYGYIVETSDGDTVDSCFGYYGIDSVTLEAKSQAEYWIKEHAKIDATLQLEVL